MSAPSTIEALRQNPISIHVFYNELNHALNMYDPNQTQQLPSKFGHIVRMTGIDKAVMDWMQKYGAALDEIRLGVDEVLANRVRMYFGDEFEATHGTLRRYSPQQRGAGTGLVDFNLGKKGFETPDVRTSANHVVSMIRQKIAAQKEELPKGENNIDDKVAEMLASLNQQPERIHSLELEGRWAVRVLGERLTKNSPFYKLMFSLVVLSDNALWREGEERYREKKKLENLKDFSDRLDVEEIDLIFAASIRQNHRFRSLELGAFRGIDHSEAIQTILATGQWKNVDNVDERDKLAKEHDFDPNNQNLVDVMIPTKAAQKYIVVVNKEDENLTVEAVLSKNEISKNINDFKKRAGRVISQIIEERLAKAVNHKKAILEMGFAGGTTDLSPMDIMVSAWSQNELFQSELNEVDEPEVFKDFILIVVENLKKVVPMELIEWLSIWEDAVGNNRSIKDDDIPTKLGVTKFGEKGWESWNIDGDVLDPQITYNFKLLKFD